MTDRQKEWLGIGAAAVCSLLVWGGLQLGWPRPLVLLLTVTAVLAGGWETGRKGLRALARLRFDMNALMTIAVTGALIIGEWTEAAVVAWLFGVSEFLEGYTVRRARASLRSLLDLTPPQARRLTPAGEETVAVAALTPGDRIVVRPGERIAADGVVAAGQAAVNQAAVTGESVPVARGPGDTVFAGTINENGLLEIEVSKPATDSLVARMLTLVEEAQSQRAPVQAFINRFAAVYTPIVLVFAVLVATVPPLAGFGPWRQWVYEALALLVVACPCALVISTPVALLASIGRASQAGVLIKGGRYVEALARIDAVAFDKTGTLTAGRPVVQTVIPFGPADAAALLQTAALLEHGSTHPLARAIVEAAAAAEPGAEGGAAAGVAQLENVTETPGHGIQASIGGVAAAAGTVAFLQQLGVAVSAEGEQAAAELQAAGQTVIAVARGGELLGLLGLADRLRPEAPQLIEQLQQAGLRRLVVLTGDHEAAAAAVAAPLGLTDVRAGLLPGEKLTAVAELEDAGAQVAMVGDGINDAPALARATVGIAVGGTGSDAALETADVVLMQDDLGRLPFAIRLSRQTMRIIRQNIALAIGLKTLAVLLVVPGWLTLWLAIVGDMGATILVTLNSMRLQLYARRSA